MKKKYISPNLKVVSIKTPTLLLSTSKGVNVDVNGNNQEIIDGGTTDPDENYNPW